MKTMGTIEDVKIKGLTLRVEYCYLSLPGSYWEPPFSEVDFTSLKTWDEAAQALVELPEQDDQFYDELIEVCIQHAEDAASAAWEDKDVD